MVEELHCCSREPREEGLPLLHLLYVGTEIVIVGSLSLTRWLKSFITGRIFSLLLPCTRLRADLLFWELWNSQLFTKAKMLKISYFSVSESNSILPQLL